MFLTGLMVVCLSGVAMAEEADTSKALQTIAKNAQVGNGDVRVGKYEVAKFDEAKAIKEMLVVKTDYPKCGPWKGTKFRRDGIAQIRKFGSDAATADALTELYKDKKIARIYSIRTNNEIDCSRLWVDVYTVDGNKLELYYGMND
jgi:hypothetical protein